MIPQDIGILSFVEPDALLTAVGDFKGATSWSGRVHGYPVPDTGVPRADAAIGRAADLVSKLPPRYSWNFAMIAGAAMQGAVDAVHADQITVRGEDGG